MLEDPSLLLSLNHVRMGGVVADKRTEKESNRIKYIRCKLRIDFEQPLPVLLKYTPCAAKG
jgi:hypothetical protein